MSLFINTNVWSLNAQRALALSQAELTRSLERLSTSLRINRASDDPVGNAVVERYTAQINGIDQARRNVSHGTVFVQHADSNLKSVNKQLQAIRGDILAANVNASSSSSADVSARQALQDKIQVALAEVERLVQSTEFDGRKILNGTSSNTIFQVGPNAADTVGITIGNFRSDQFGLYRLKGNPTGTKDGLARGRSGENLTLQGSLGTRTVNIPGSGTGSSAYETAAAVNGVKESTGIHASARTEFEIVKWSTTTAGYQFTIVGKNIGNPITITESVVVVAGAAGPKGIESFGGLINAIKAKQHITGVDASLNGEEDGIILTSDAGYNIALNFDFATNPSTTKDLEMREPTLSRATGVPTATPYARTLTSTLKTEWVGQLIFDSEKPFTVISEDLTARSATYPSEGLSLFPVASGTTSGKPTMKRSAVLVPISSIDVTGADAVDRILNDQRTGVTGLGEPKSSETTTPAVSEGWVLQGAIREALAVIDHAMAAVTTQQAALGSAQDRFGAIIKNLDSDFVNLSSARGYIQDADIALETSIQTRASIQQQVNIAILGQANALQQAVLALLR